MFQNQAENNFYIIYKFVPALKQHTKPILVFHFIILYHGLFFPVCFCLQSLLYLLSGFDPALLFALLCCRCGCCTALRRKLNRCSSPLGQLVRPARPIYGSQWVRLCPNWAWPDCPNACLRSDHRAGGTSPADVSPVGCPSLHMEPWHCARTTEPLEGHTSSPTARRMATEHRGSVEEWGKRLFFHSYKIWLVFLDGERIGFSHVMIRRCHDMSYQHSFK